MKTKICLLGIFALVTLAIAAPHTWILKTGETVAGDYVSSGTTTLVVKTGGTNCFLKISNLSTNDQAYAAEIQAKQKQAQLDAEAKQKESVKSSIIGKWQGQWRWEFFSDGSLDDGSLVCNYRFIDADHIRVERPSHMGLSPGHNNWMGSQVEAPKPMTIPAESQIYSVSLSNEVLRLIGSYGSVLTFKRLN
ncbi:MAG: hypothetical protein ABSF10_17880 [Verrucomicrobiota bacterium]|jgi:hypothetical protein